MEQFAHINVQQALELMQQRGAVLADIRDPQSFAKSHPTNAFHLTNQTMIELLNEHDYETPIIVICYHGISSQGAAQYLLSQGFEEVYSVDGGFEAWAKEAPVTHP